MGDSACVLQGNGHSMGDSACVLQGNVMHNLTDSVSLGRFMSEQLAWEKWSTFSSNRYVEEAERYAQPGSVAQKKAFFEAHYKKIAAQKAAAAAAAAEQANDSVVSDHSTNHAAPEAVTVTITVTAPPPPPLTTHHHHAPPPPPPPEKVEEEFLEPEGLVVKEEEPLMEVIAPPESEKPLLIQQNCSSEREDVSSVKMKKKSAFSSLKSSVYRKTSSKIPVSSPARLPQVKKQGGANGVTSAATPTIKSKKKPALDITDKKRPPAAPKSPLHLFVNSSPVKQLTQLLSPSRKIDAVNSSRIAPDSSNKMSQNCKTPLAAQNMMSRHSAAVATPCPADTRTNTPADGIKTAGPKRHILSTLCSKSLTACRNKLQSPTLSTPFLLRTEERAARRKQKLEEKFDSKKDVEKVKVQPPQTSFKEKAESELRKLQQSFCFKARPLPDFYKEREAQNNQIKKNPVTTQPQSPKLGRKPNSSRTAKNAVSLPKPTQKMKSGILKHVTASSSLQEMINHENSSPNIQQ